MNGMNILASGSFLADLETKLSAIRNDFDSSSAFSGLTAEQREAFYMAIALDQYDRTGVALDSGVTIFVGK